MPKIKLRGQVMDEIYSDAINLIPNGGRFIANTYLSNPVKPSFPKEAFERTIAQMRHMINGDSADFLKSATAEYLQKHYGFPVSDMNAYEFRAGRDSITLRPFGEQAVSFSGWLNRLGLAKNQTTLSAVGDIRGYDAIAPDELIHRLDEHNKWLSDRKQIMESAKDLFKLDDSQLGAFLKTMPATRLDLSGCEIKNMDFRRQNLDGVNFKNARFENCAFSHAQGADFSGAVMERCRFQEGNLSYSDFSQSQQNDVRFENCRMEQVDFTNARMKQVTFSGCDLRSAIFNGIDLNALKFEQPEPVQAQAPQQEIINPQEQQVAAQKPDINIRYAEPVMKMEQQ